MKKFIYALAAIAAAMISVVSCDDMTDDEKKNAAENFTKVLLAGEYGVMSVTGQDGQPALGALSPSLDKDGHPTLIMVLNIDGTYFMANNRVWNDHYLDGTWDVVDGKIQLVTSVVDEVLPGDRYSIVSFENDILTFKNDLLTYQLKRLTDADKCPQLRSIIFTDGKISGGRMEIDPRQELNAAGKYQITYKFDPEGYEPLGPVEWTSSNPEVATISGDGYLTPAAGVTSGETVITVECDCVRSISLTVKLNVIN